MRGAATILLLLLSATGRAEEPELDPAAVAQEAFDASTRACAGRGQRNTTARLDARASVAPTLVRISRAWDQHHIPYLLYWRGVLGLCLGEVTATQDLEGYLRLSKGDPGSKALRADAERRLRRIVREQHARTGPSPASVVMTILGGSAAAVGTVLAAQARQEGQGLQASMSTLDGWVANHGAYEASQTRQRAGFAVLSAGSGVAVFGIITIPLGRTAQ